MLRVGLTGGLGSGKSTVARIFVEGGVDLLQADEIGRELMQPGQPVYRRVLDHFRQFPDAPPLLLADGALDRASLARYAFSSGRIEELSRIVHPAVIAEQERRIRAIFAERPAAIVVVESALIFEADRAGTAPGLRRRFDTIILVTAPDPVKIARYVARMTGGRALSAEERSRWEQDARQRIAAQIPDSEKAPLCDFVIPNSGAMEETEAVARQVLQALRNNAAAGCGQALRGPMLPG